MRFGLALLVVVFAAVARGADDAPKVTDTPDGKQIKFPDKVVADGVKATLALLAPSHDESLFRDDEFENALKGDHVRLVSPKPIKLDVMGERVEFSGLVFRRPLTTGVFWVREGGQVAAVREVRIPEAEGVRGLARGKLGLRIETAVP